MGKVVYRNKIRSKDVREELMIRRHNQDYRYRPGTDKEAGSVLHKKGTGLPSVSVENIESVSMHDRLIGSLFFA